MQLDGGDQSKLPGPAVAHIANFWTEIGYLVESGHMEAHLVHRNLGGHIEAWWARLLPTTLSWREIEGEHLFETFETLVRQMETLNRKSGVTTVLDDAELTRRLPVSIEQAEGRIRRGRERRAVLVRPLSTATLAAVAPPVLGPDPGGDEKMGG